MAAYLVFGEAYRRTRFFDSWLDPWADPKKSGYQLIQGLIAIGSGGWLGTGLGTSRAKWDFLPNAHSDFIFAVIGEELGLLGTLVVLIGFGVLLWAGIRIAIHAPGTFERLLAAGIVSWIGLQTVINLGAVTGLLPITGVPLPLVSFGGSALVVTLAGIGVLAGIARGSAAGKGARGRAGAAAGKALAVRVVVAGGGTAGHVFPALAMADALRARHGAEVEFLGASDGQEARLVPAAGYPFTPMHVTSAQTRVSARSVHALRLARAAARRVRPQVARADVVVGIGGFASAPGAMAARRTRRPLVLVEQNSVPGAVNRIAARWARGRGRDVRGNREPRCRLERASNGPATRSAPRSSRCRPIVHRSWRRRAAEFGLDAERRTVVVLGGSQGAQHLDEVVASAVGLLRDRDDLQLLVSHRSRPRGGARGGGAGRGRPCSCARAVSSSGWTWPSRSRTSRWSRAGAGHIAELTVCGVPMILVPYPHATENHQEANARELERAGAAEVVLDRDLTAERFAVRVGALVEDVERRASMASAASGWARPDADVRLATLVAAVAGGAG